MPRKYPKERSKKGASVKERVSAYRRRMRSTGFRPVEVWVPDTRDPQFRRSFRKQCAAVAAVERADAATEAWLDANAADLSRNIERNEAAAAAPPFQWGPESPV